MEALRIYYSLFYPFLELESMLAYLQVIPSPYLKSLFWYIIYNFYGALHAKSGHRFIQPDTIQFFKRKL